MCRYVTMATNNNNVPDGKIVISNSGNSNVNINVGK